MIGRAVFTGLFAAGSLTSVAAATIGVSRAVGATALPAFRASITPVTAAQLGGTWHPGCPVGPPSLRSVHLDYVGFDGVAHEGTIVVAKSVTSAVITVFRSLYDARFPIHSMVPEAAFAGKDPISMAADNTSGFNCRYAVANGPKSWSVHAYGEAIDVNPVQNPYLFNGVAEPAVGAPYLHRGDVRPGMAVAGGVLVRAFAAVGWYWGGRWTASPDYQHFSATGQ